MWYVEDLGQGNRIQESEVMLSHGDLSYGQLGYFQLFLIVPLGFLSSHTGLCFSIRKTERWCPSLYCYYGYSIQHGVQVHIIPIQVAIWNLQVPLSPSFSFGGRLVHLR